MPKSKVKKKKVVKKKTNKKLVKKKKASKVKKTIKKKTGKSPKKKLSRRAGKKKQQTVIAYLGLGSNVGDREEYIEQAIFLLGKYPKVEVVNHSSNYETEPEGGGNQPPFINAAVEVKTKLSAEDLLDVCNEIEATLGREREIEWGPRTIDIDILLYDDEISTAESLQLPHPLMHERLFVLRPLREIAPKAMHPVLEKNIESLYDERKAELGAKYDDELPGFREIKGARFDDFQRW